jgi:hypothetical protein
MKKEFPDISFNGDIWRKFNDIESFESQVHSGDTSQIWFSQIVATQHRMPCYKLGGQILYNGHNKKIFRFEIGKLGFTLRLSRKK